MGSEKPNLNKERREWKVEQWNEERKFYNFE